MQGFKRLSTHSVPVAQRFDYWRSLHGRIELDTAERSVRDDFQASLLTYNTPDGIGFGQATSDGVVGRFGSRVPHVVFSLTVAGCVTIAGSGDRAEDVTPPSGLVVFETGVPFLTRTRNHTHIYLSVPRARLSGVVDRVGGLSKDGFAVLPLDGLAGILASHLSMIAKENRRLTGYGARSAVGAAAGMAPAVLQQVLDGNVPGDNLDADALHAAALRYLHLHMGERNLSSERMASDLGCSRSHLYRVFAERDMSVGHALRMLRLERAQALLVSDASLSVEDVARHCGYANASSFIRTFRHETGLTPAAFRRERPR